MTTRAIRQHAQTSTTILVLFAAFVVHARGATYFVATNGDDDDDGTLTRPFATFAHAIAVAGAGDTIYVRGGTYLLDQTIAISKAGAPGAPIRLWAYQSEIPILDFGDNPRHANPPQPRDDDTIAATSDALGIFVASGGNWWHLKGLVVQDAPYYGVRVYGSNNVFERLVLRDNQAAGLELTGKEGWSPSDNLVLNCDAYLNFDPQTNGEDADGFAAKFDSLGPGNVFRGLRAWSNSDDGFDFWHATHPVLLEDCWSFDNGFFRPEWDPEVSGSWRGDGLGFKLGQDAAELVLNRIVAFGNKAFGIDENGNGSPGGVVIHNATLVNNAKDGNPTQIQLNDGRPHTVRNTIAFDVDGDDVTDFSPEVDDTFNTWNGIGVSAGDFLSIDMDELYAAATGPRNADGSLPAIGLRLEPDSHLVDAGTDVGLPFTGAAPDLGAFEVGLPVPGDLDGDLDVDADDLLRFASCLAGPGELTPPPGCDPATFAAADFDGDGDVDSADFNGFAPQFTGWRAAAGTGVQRAGDGRGSDGRGPALSMSCGGICIRSWARLAGSHRSQHGCLSRRAVLDDALPCLQQWGELRWWTYESGPFCLKSGNVVQ